MTLLPTHDAIDRPDLPEYPLSPSCAVCGEAREPGGGHHIWRRSNQTKSWWVESADALYPNRVGLCPRHHHDVTGGLGGHKAEIVIHGSGHLHYRYIGQEGNEVRLRFDPDPFTVLERSDWSDVPETTFDAPLVEGTCVREGETCPQCNRRVPHKKKKDSPTTKVFSVRIPIDDVEVFKETLEATAEHLGLSSKPHAPFWTLNACMALALQAPKGLLE